MPENRIIMLCKDVLRPLLNSVSGHQIPYKVIVRQHVRLLPKKPVIYAANHFCFADTPIMGRAVPKRAYILLGRQRLRLADRLYFFLNGVIWVDRKDKVSREASKAEMISYLNKRRSIIMFPEGTWNLTDNMLLLPMKWGIIQIAQETGAQIVPTILEYDRDCKQCYVSFGEPMHFLPTDEKANAIAALRDTMGTMVWNVWERRGAFSRAALDLEAERKKLRFSIEEYPTIDWEYEESCVYHPYVEPSEVFAHLDMLIPSKENAFLFDKRLTG